jgi:predicted ABC-type ATPase
LWLTPNGSGKSTFGEVYFKAIDSGTVYLNPDLIASGLSLSGSGTAAIQAGRILISEVKNRILSGESLCFESTLSGVTWAPILAEAKEIGYSIRIYFLYLKNVQKNLARIKKRVRMGGGLPTICLGIFLPEARVPRCFFSQ